MAAVSLDLDKGFEAVKFEAQTQSLINERVGEVYRYVAAGLVVTTLSACAFVHIGLAAAFISKGSLLFLGAVGIALLAGTILTPKENSTLKHGLYGLFTVCEGLILSPLLIKNATAFAVAGAASSLITGALGALAMSLKESFEKYETILMVALGAIAIASFGSLLLPSVYASFCHEVSLFGGLAVFTAFTIYDTHKTRSDALNPDFDPIDHAVDIYLDALNIMVRIWEIYDRVHKDGNY